MVTEGEFIEFVAEVFECDVVALSLGMSYEDIPDWDSIKYLKLIMSLEEKYGVSVTFEDIQETKSLGDLIAFINK